MDRCPASYCFSSHHTQVTWVSSGCPFVNGYMPVRFWKSGVLNLLIHRVTWQREKGHNTLMGGDSTASKRTGRPEGLSPPLKFLYHCSPLAWVGHQLFLLSNFQYCGWNPGPRVCQGSTLPLSYIPDPHLLSKFIFGNCADRTWTFKLSKSLPSCWDCRHVPPYQAKSNVHPCLPWLHIWEGQINVWSRNGIELYQDKRLGLWQSLPTKVCVNLLSFFIIVLSQTWSI